MTYYLSENLTDRSSPATVCLHGVKSERDVSGMAAAMGAPCLHGGSLHTQGLPAHTGEPLSGEEGVAAGFPGWNQALLRVTRSVQPYAISTKPLPD